MVAALEDHPSLAPTSRTATAPKPTQEDYDYGRGAGEDRESVGKNPIQILKRIQIQWIQERGGLPRRGIGL